jgi:hypothetical protein
MTDIEKTIEKLKEEIKALQARQALSEKALKALHEIDKITWIEAYYDPLNQASLECAHLVRPHIEVLKEELKF